MAIAFRLPDLGEGITEAEVIEWRVAAGDTVAEHQVLLTVETDKALVEVPAPAAGRIGRIRHQAGDTVHVGEVLVWILAAGETEAARSGAEPERAVAGGTIVGTLDTPVVDLPPPSPPEAGAERVILATPAVRRLARELGVPLEAVRGSGLGGRITEADLREHAQARAPAEAAPRAAPGAAERVPLRGIRRVVARRLMEAVSHAALVTHMDEIDVTGLVEGSAAGGLLAPIVKAVAETLRRHPRFNATLDDAHEEVLIHHEVNIGIAVDTPDGLMVPVIRRVDQLAVDAVAAAIEELARACRERTVGIAALRGGTFSVSNIGALSGTFATPIPNYPEVAILATGRVGERLARARDGTIVSRWILPVSLSFDHRVLDGADAARFVATLRELLAAGVQSK